jgi:ATP-dependent protease ClpP protease subunit
MKQGQPAFEFANREALRLTARLVELLTHHTSQPQERIAQDINRIVSLPSKAAIEYGIADWKFDASREQHPDITP